MGDLTNFGQKLMAGGGELGAEDGKEFFELGERASGVQVNRGRGGFFFSNGEAGDALGDGKSSVDELNVSWDFPTKRGF